MYTFIHGDASVGDEIFGLVVLLAACIVATYLAAIILGRLRDVLGFANWRPVLVAIIALGLTFIVVFVAMARTIWKSEDGIVIAAVAVPKYLAEQGWTSAVVAQHLRAAILEVMDTAETSIPGPAIRLSTDPTHDSYVSIKEFEFSPAILTEWLRSLFGNSHHNEVTADLIDGDGSKLRLVLRYNNREVADPLERQGAEFAKCLASRFTTARSDAVPNVDALLMDGALRLLKLNYPYYIAAACYRKEPKLALQMADQIIASYPPNSEIVARAYNLQGLIYTKSVHCPDPSESFKMAIDADPGLALPYFDWAEYMIVVYRKYKLAIDKETEWLRYAEYPEYPEYPEYSGTFYPLDRPAAHIERADAQSGGLSPGELDIAFADALRMRSAPIGPADGGKSDAVDYPNQHEDAVDAAELYELGATATQREIDSHPSDASLYADLGDARVGQAILDPAIDRNHDSDRHIAEALAAYSRAIDMRSESYDAHFGRFMALVYFASRLPSDADNRSEAMKEAKREWFWLHVNDNLTVAYGSQDGDYPRVMQILRETLHKNWREPDPQGDRPRCDGLESVIAPP